jgi:hypothetical protein
MTDELATIRDRLAANARVEDAKFLEADLKKLRDEIVVLDTCIAQERARGRPNTHAVKVLQAMAARNHRMIRRLEYSRDHV